MIIMSSRSVRKRTHSSSENPYNFPLLSVSPDLSNDLLKKLDVKDLIELYYAAEKGTTLNKSNRKKIEEILMNTFRINKNPEGIYQISKVRLDMSRISAELADGEASYPIEIIKKKLDGGKANVSELILTAFNLHCATKNLPNVLDQSQFNIETTVIPDGYVDENELVELMKSIHSDKWEIRVWTSGWLSIVSNLQLDVIMLRKATCKAEDLYACSAKNLELIDCHLPVDEIIRFVELNISSPRHRVQYITIREDIKDTHTRLDAYFKDKSSGTHRIDNIENYACYPRDKNGYGFFTEITLRFMSRE